VSEPPLGRIERFLYEQILASERFCDTTAAIAAFEGWTYKKDYGPYTISERTGVCLDSHGERVPKHLLKTRRAAFSRALHSLHRKNLILKVDRYGWQAGCTFTPPAHWCVNILPRAAVNADRKYLSFQKPAQELHKVKGGPIFPTACTNAGSPASLSSDGRKDRVNSPGTRTVNSCPKAAVNRETSFPVNLAPTPNPEASSDAIREAGVES
jgi:hypothetical protein